MKKLLALPVICLMLASCNGDRRNNMADMTNAPNAPQQTQQYGRTQTYQSQTDPSQMDQSQMDDSQTDQSQLTDWAITAQIKKNLMMDNSLSANARMISVSTDNGVVTLTGTVANQEENRRIMSMVQRVDGVMSVNNRLTVSSR